MNGKLYTIFSIISSSRSALALVLLAFWRHRWVSYSRTGLLVRQYFYFCTEYSYMHV